MERRTLREFSALQHRQRRDLSNQDLMHARTASSMGGGKLQDLLIFPIEGAVESPGDVWSKVCNVMGSINEDNG